MGHRAGIGGLVCNNKEPHDIQRARAPANCTQQAAELPRTSPLAGGELGTGALGNGPFLLQVLLGVVSCCVPLLGSNSWYHRRA
jgi:hypothetical protein